MSTSNTLKWPCFWSAGCFSHCFSCRRMKSRCLSNNFRFLKKLLKVRWQFCGFGWIWSKILFYQKRLFHDHIKETYFIKCKEFISFKATHCVSFQFILEWNSSSRVLFWVITTTNPLTTTCIITWQCISTTKPHEMLRSCWSFPSLTFPITTTWK